MPVSGATVIASSAQKRFERATGSNGKYVFDDLPPGKYKVQVIMPAKMSPVHDEELEIHDHGCAQLDFRVVSDGRIRGRLLDARGQPLGIKTVDLISGAAR